MDVLCERVCRIDGGCGVIVCSTDRERGLGPGQAGRRREGWRGGEE